MYQVGDLILYGRTGVCRVEEIRPLSLRGADKDRLYYILQPLYQTCSITTPTDNPRVFMRPIISAEEANRLIDQIPEVTVSAFHSQSLSQLKDHYAEAIATHSCEELIALTMSIYSKKQAAEREKRKFGSVDERYMKEAENLLFGELAAALGIDRDQVAAYIHDRLCRKQPV